MTPDLATTNALLAILATVSVLEALALVGVLVWGFVLYKRLVQAIGRIEERQIAPVASRVTAILDDVKGVTSVVRLAADGAESGVRAGLSWLFKQLRKRDA